MWVQSCFNAWYELVHLSLSFPLSVTGRLCRSSFTAETMELPQAFHGRVTLMRLHSTQTEREIGLPPCGYIKKPCVPFKQHRPREARGSIPNNRHYNAHKAAGCEVQWPALNALSALKPPYPSWANSMKKPSACLMCHNNEEGISCKWKEITTKAWCTESPAGSGKLIHWTQILPLCLFFVSVASRNNCAPCWPQANFFDISQPLVRAGF